jgi:hypothetical protein
MDGIRTEKETINGIEVETTQFLPMRAHKLLMRLARVMGPALGEIANVEVGELGEISKMNLASMGPALMRMFSEMDEATAEKLPLEILAGTTAVVTDANGNKRRHQLDSIDGFNQTFIGHGITHYLVMGFALKVNYARFLDELAKLAPEVPAKANP